MKGKSGFENDTPYPLPEQIRRREMRFSRFLARFVTVFGLFLTGDPGLLGNPFQGGRE